MAQSSDHIRVLLADDHVMVRAGIRQLLEHSGDIQIIAEASDGETAQALIRQYHPAVHEVNEGKSVLDAVITQKLMAQLFSGSKSSIVEQPTDREMEVLSLVAKGFNNKGIGMQLGISD